MNEQLQQLIDAVKAASPYVWHAAYRYVIVDGIAGIVIGLVFLCLSRYLYSLIDKYELQDEGFFFCVAGIVISSIIGVITVVCYAEQLLTLDYQAIVALTQLVKK